ncbi:MAG: hypothetical protein GX057_05360 [Clostridiales bacterium]|nr:hypothetical protein [Clostridiales bacterium]HOA84771.1 hypothetical protein [Bacillota bacterium]
MKNAIPFGENINLFYLSFSIASFLIPASKEISRQKAFNHFCHMYKNPDDTSPLPRQLTGSGVCGIIFAYPAGIKLQKSGAVL